MAAANQAAHGTVSLQYPVLTKSNYSVWAIKMEVYMEAQGVWDAVQSEEPVENRRDKMALAAIYQGISEETLLQLGPRKTAKEAWNALKTMHLGATRVKEVRAQALKWELESFRMKDSESMDDFIGKITITVNQLRSLGEEIEEGYVVKKILRAVSPKFLQIASTIEEFGNVSTKTVEEITGSLKAHEERMRGAETVDEGIALLSKGEWKPPVISCFDERQSRENTSYRGRAVWRGGRQSRGYARGQGNRGRYADGERFRPRIDRSQIRCYNCQEFGHFASECNGKGKEEEVNFGEEEDEYEPALLMAEEIDEKNEKKNVSEKVGDEIVESTWY